MSDRNHGHMVPRSNGEPGYEKEWTRAIPNPAILSLPISCNPHMEQDHVQESPPAQGFCESLLADAPWQAKSFLAAAVAMIAGLASWITNYSSPAAARIAGSYLGG